MEVGLNPYESPHEETRRLRPSVPDEDLAKLKRHALYVFAGGIAAMTLAALITAPIAIVFGVRVLRKHPHQFPRKWLLIVGLILSVAGFLSWISLIFRVLAAN